MLTEMENDPTRNSMEPPIDGEGLVEGVELEDETELELNEYSESLFLEDDCFDDSGTFGNHEFSALNRQLDQLQSALDEIESRNADIHKELLEILHSNREVRKTMSEENSKGNSSNGQQSLPSSTSRQNIEVNHSLDESKTAELLVKADSFINSTSMMSQLLHSVTQDIDNLTT